MNDQKQKCVVLGVTGSVAAFKAATVASMLKKQGVDVYVIMTKNATEFIAPLTFESITNNPVANDMFERDTPWEIEHISLAKRADIFLVAPASANFIGKLAQGIADDMLTTTAMATKAKIVLAPAMNTNMYLSAANQANIQTLAARGCEFIAPESGVLACNDVGVGRLADPEVIVRRVLELLNKKQDLRGKKILVTAGPTREYIDPVRFLSNRSSGKMGYAIAQAAHERGAEVTLISGPVDLCPISEVQMIQIQTSQEMYDAVMQNYQAHDIIVKAAAPADYTPKEFRAHKIKKTENAETEAGDWMLALSKTKDILGAVAKNKGNRFVCGFAAETRDLEKYALKKLEAKKLDLIVANNVLEKGAGFEGDTNIVTLYFADGTKKSLPLQQKKAIADALLDEIIVRVRA